MNKKRKPTIDSIAKELGISRAQVSRALHDYDKVKPSTKRLVKETAERMGYTKNIAAKGLSTGRKYNLGFYFPIDLNYCNLMQSYWRLETFSGVMDEASRNNYHVTVFNDNQNREVLDNLEIDGCVTTANALGLVEHLNCPKLILYGRVDREYDHDHIIVSAEDAMEEAVRIIAERRPSSIVLLCLSESDVHSGNVHKLETYKLLFQKHGIPINAGNVLEVERSFNAVSDAVMSLLGSLKKPAVIVCMSDSIALDVVRTALALKLKIPDELAVLGFDDAPYSATITPAITTFGKDRYDIGRMAVRMLLERINSKSSMKPRREIINAELLRRDTM